MITFHDFLAESRSAPLYHGTTLVNLTRILDTQQLQARKPYFENNPVVSLSRDIRLATTWARVAKGRESSAVIELDQQKLTQRYKIQPFNYFSSSSVSTDEYEERSYRTINDIDKYITKIILQEPPHPKLNPIIANHPALYYDGKFLNRV
jgi:hypothetical protein